MGRISQLEVVERITELKKLKKKQVKPKNIDRLNVLLYIKEERFKTRAELSNYIGVTRRTIEKWLSHYRNGGLDEMLIPNKRIRKSHLISPEIDKAIKERVFDRERGFLSYIEAQSWLATEFGLDLKYNTVREHLIRHYKTKIKSPRKSHVKKDPEAVTAFLKTA